MVRHCLIAAPIAVLTLVGATPAQEKSVPTAPAVGAVDFTRDVRPILARYCFKCHGPDEKLNKGGVRLDVRELAIDIANSGQAAIVPGNVKESQLVQRIFSMDEDKRMPPVSTKNVLTEQQKETLKKWIA